MRFSMAVEHRGRRERAGRVAQVWLGSLLCWASPASARSEGVRVSCPEFDSEQAAEIEARVRASLLAVETQATVSITCDAQHATVRIESTNGEAALETLSLGPNLREELLGALDRGFEKLAQRVAREPPPALVEGTIESPSLPSPVLQNASPPRHEHALEQRAPALSSQAPAPATSADAARHSVLLQAPSTPIFVNAVGERWSSRLAAGAEIGSEWAWGKLRYGARIGALVPVSAESTFRLSDWHGLAHVAARPRVLGGVQFTSGFGVSIMRVSPRGAATSRESSVVSAPFAFVAVNRALRFGHWAFLPELGIKLFAAERGVRVDERERVRFGWLVPRLALGVGYLE